MRLDVGGWPSADEVYICSEGPWQAIGGSLGAVGVGVARAHACARSHRTGIIIGIKDPLPRFEPLHGCWV